jgi:TonB-linked SusC/RagA family outer membrane protein
MRKVILTMLVALGFVLGAVAQDRTVSGKVTDEGGKALEGVSVTSSDNKGGTKTDASGSFSINIGANIKALTFSSIGYESQRINVKGGNVTVKMKTVNNTLDDVVVTVPYGSVKKKAFTGAENSINSSTIQKQQVTNVTRALEGLIPGLIATNGGGAPGTGAGVLVRGVGSINASSSPLYVLNGIPYDGSISALNSDDIENITVLKDAAAAALYGSRAANGVIMITTKKGKKGAPVFSINARQGFMSRLIPEYDRVDTKDYYELFWESYKNANIASGQNPILAGQNASTILTSSSGLVYNAYNVPGATLVDPTTGKLNPNAKLLWQDSWEKELFRNAMRTNVSANVSGGGDFSDFYLSAGYLNEEGIVKNSGYKSYNMRMNVNASPNKWFKTGINLDGAFSKRQDVPSGGTSTTNPFYFTRQIGPIYPVFQYNTTTGAPVLDADGKPAYDYGVPAQMGTRPYAGRSNIASTLFLDDRSRRIFNGNANIFGEIILPYGFSFKSTFGLNFFSNDITSYQNNQFGDASPSTPGGSDGGRSTKTSDKAISYTGNQVLSWNKQIGNHNIRALIGHENYAYRYNVLTGGKSGFLFPGYTDLDNGATVLGLPSSREDNLRIESYFSNVNYDYKSKYLLSGSFRTDGSSRFNPSDRWGNFYSVGLGWRISQEKFLKKLNWLSELKLRASYGEQGNDALADASGNSLYYAYQDYYDANGTGSFTFPGRFGNKNLKWETNSVLNFGLDFGFLKNRITGTLEVYTRQSSNLLFDVPLALSNVGGVSVYQNIGTMENKGIELQLGLGIVTKKAFNWRVDLNLTKFKNRITKLPPTQTEKGIVVGTKKLLADHSIYDFWLPDFAGVDASNGDNLYYRDITDASGKIVDKAVTNVYNQATFYYFGSALPKISGGITNTFSYKDFDLSILTIFSYGGLFYDGNYASIMHRGAAGTAWSSDILNRWQKPGDVTNVPRLQNAVAGNDGVSSKFLIDGSYLNIKNITLSYTFLKNGLNKNIGSAQFYLNVDNAFLFTAKKGSDPQRSFAGTSDATYTPFRTTSVGIKFNIK